MQELGVTMPYSAMAREDELAWPTLDDVTKTQAFLDPVLAGGLDATWLLASARVDVAGGVST